VPFTLGLDLSTDPGLRLGAKARTFIAVVSARVNSRPDTKPARSVFVVGFGAGVGRPPLQPVWRPALLQEPNLWISS
jgi:hypothetical protein